MKSVIDFIAAPSFQDGSGSAARAGNSKIATARYAKPSILKLARVIPMALIDDETAPAGRRVRSHGNEC
jgi:hypothetical protein